MLTCNKLMTNVLYSEAVKGSLYATPNTAHRRPFSTCSPHKLSNGVSWSRIGCSSGEKLEHGWFWYQASKKIHFSSPPRNGQHTQSPLRACFSHYLEKFFASSDETFSGWFGPYVTSCNCMLSIKKLTIICLPKNALSFLLFSLLSFAEAPTGYPNKNSNYRKNRKRTRHGGKKKKASFFLSFPFPSRPERFLFLSSQPPTTKKRA